MQNFANALSGQQTVQNAQRLTSLTNQRDVIIYDPPVRSIDDAKNSIVSYAISKPNSKKIGTRFRNDLIVYDINKSTFMIIAGIDSISPDVWIDKVNMS